jgi:adenylate cyclase
MLELERTYLLKAIPEWLSAYPHKDLLDIYIPLESDHALIRIRKHGDSMVIMKKELTHPWDLSSMEESVIHLTMEEFDALQQVPGKRIHKHRYYVPYQGLTIEIDVFQENLQWLIMADVEFSDEATKENFQMPDFCLTEITQDVTFAGGLLCGKLYEDISEKLASLWYIKLNFN